VHHSHPIFYVHFSQEAVVKKNVRRYNRKWNTSNKIKRALELMKYQKAASQIIR